MTLLKEGQDFLPYSHQNMVPFAWKTGVDSQNPDQVFDWTPGIWGAYDHPHTDGSKQLE